MGAVNRCWRCGARFEAEGIRGEEPPVRRPAAPKTDSQPGAGAAEDSANPAAAEAAPQPPSTTKARPRAGTSLSSRPRTAALGGVIGSLFLGVFSLLAVTRISWVGALLAVVGLAVALWGLRSTRPGWAWLGILLCLATLGISLFQAAIWLFEAMYGVGPFDTGPVTP